MKTKVVHCKEDSYDIYIGRKKNTNNHYGNPFRIDKNCTRDESISNFRMWILGFDFNDIESERRKWILIHIKDLKGKTLGCWCKPKACHGDILAELVDKGD
jgi:hypothetical protein